MAGENNRPRGQDPQAAASSEDSKTRTKYSVSAADKQPNVGSLRTDPRFRRMTQHLHRLGPRPVGELLAELAAAHGIAGDVLARLERFGSLDPATVAALDARDWPPLPMHEVAA